MLMMLAACGPMAHLMLMMRVPAACEFLRFVRFLSFLENLQACGKVVGSESLGNGFRKGFATQGFEEDLQRDV